MILSGSRGAAADGGIGNDGRGVGEYGDLLLYWMTIDNEVHVR